MKKALVFWGGWDGHDPENVSLRLKKILEANGFEVDRFEGTECLKDGQKLLSYDLIVPCVTMGDINGEYTKNISKAISEGVGLAGCHGGMCDAFRNNTNWQFMTGAQWVAHPGNGDVTYEVNINKASSSSLVEGIDDFTVTSEQYYIHIDPAVDVLATTTFTYPGNHTVNGKITVPVAFTKRWGQGKVYYNSLGHNRHIFDIPQAKEMMRRGFLYAAR